jgi:hypothetical protein
MANRERKIFVKPEEWFGRENDDRRAKMMQAARKEAKRHLALVMIVVKDRSGQQIIGRFDARYWLFEPDRLERPPAGLRDFDLEEIAGSHERTKRLRPPSGLFDE